MNYGRVLSSGWDGQHGQWEGRLEQGETGHGEHVISSVACSGRECSIGLCILKNVHVCVVRGHQAIPQAPEQSEGPEDPRRQLSPGQASPSHLSEHNFDIKGRENDAWRLRQSTHQQQGLTEKKYCFPSTCLLGLFSGNSVSATIVFVLPQPAEWCQSNTHWPPCAWVWVAVGQEGLLLVQPLIWVWGAAMCRSSYPIRKRVSDWQLGSERDAYALLLASYK